MGTSTGLDVLLGYAKANLNTFTPNELMRVISHIWNNIQPIMDIICSSTRISQAMNKTRSDWNLIGSTLKNPLESEYAMLLGSETFESGNRLSANLQVHEQTLITELFLTKRRKLVLWRVKYRSTLLADNKKWLSVIESEDLIDISDVASHEDLTPALVCNCIQLTALAVDQFCSDRRRQLQACERVAQKLESMRTLCTLKTV